VFLTHLPDLQQDATDDVTGHWITIEHNFRINHVFCWDSLPRKNISIPFNSANSQIIKQWAVTNLFRPDSSLLVRLSITYIWIHSYIQPNQCGRAFPEPRVEYYYIGKQVLKGDRLDSVASNACGFWATAFALGLTMGVPLMSIPDKPHWIKWFINKLQIEYRMAGVMQDTVLRSLSLLPFPDELISNEQYKSLVIVSNM
jgi:hypothetical protein